MCPQGGVGTIFVEILVIGAAVSTLDGTAISITTGVARSAVARGARSTITRSVVFVEITSGNGLLARVRSKLGRNGESIRVEGVGNRWGKGILELRETKAKVVS